MNAILQQIQKDVLTGVYEPGSRLNISEIKKQYGISLAPLREALSELSSQGLIGKEPNKGYFVPKLTLHELKDLYEVALTLEALAVKQSILRATPKWEEEIYASLYQLIKIESLEKKPTFNKWFKANERFHHALIANCSDHLKELLQINSLKAQRYAYAAHKHFKDSFSCFAQEHEDIAHAVLNKETSKAQQLLKAHTLKGQQILIDHHLFED